MLELKEISQKIDISLEKVKNKPRENFSIQRKSNDSPISKCFFYLEQK